MGKARARSGDPETSKASAAAVTPAKLTELQRRILRAFDVMGPMDDKALVVLVQRMEDQLGIKVSSAAGIRSRRSDLSKPNMERIADIIREMGDGVELSVTYDEALRLARQQLTIEGLRSPVWDTGRRVQIEGRNFIVWGLAANV